MKIKKHRPTNEPICHPKTLWPTWSNSLQYTGRSATACTLNKDTAMSRNSVGQDHSFRLNGTDTSESCEANGNYLQSRRCGAETKEAHLSRLFLAQEPSFKPVNIRQTACVWMRRVYPCIVLSRKRIGACELRQFPVLSQIVSTYCIPGEAQHTALHASLLHYRGGDRDRDGDGGWCVNVGVCAWQKPYSQTVSSNCFEVTLSSFYNGIGD